MSKPITVELASIRTAHAFCGKKLVGLASAWTDEDRFCVLRVGVHEPYRRRGIATALYSAIESANDTQLLPYSCDGCGFVFSAAFDHWSPEDFKRHMYNDDYVIGDPPFVEERPKRNAAMVAALFWREKDTLKVLDFGGGRGVFAAELTRSGFRADSLDAYHEPGAKRDTDYDLITSFEVIEHVPHGGQYAWLVQLKAHLKASPEAKVLIGTELMDGQEFSWFFVSPRNGHITIHTKRSFSILCERAGLTWQPISRSVNLLNLA